MEFPAVLGVPLKSEFSHKCVFVQVKNYSCWYTQLFGDFFQMLLLVGCAVNLAQLRVFLGGFWSSLWWVVFFFPVKTTRNPTKKRKKAITKARLPRSAIRLASSLRGRNSENAHGITQFQSHHLALPKCILHHNFDLLMQCH